MVRSTLHIVAPSRRTYPGRGVPSNGAGKVNKTGPLPSRHDPAPMMWHILRLRYNDSIHKVYETLQTMAHSPRLMPSSPTTPRASTGPGMVRSNASTPSLRSRDGTMPIMSRSEGGGNVKVVVRVRAFLQRGTYAQRAAWQCARGGTNGLHVYYGSC